MTRAGAEMIAEGDSGGRIPTEYLLRAEHLTKTYPGVTALADVDFALYAGEVHALIGENGAGKSTLARVICGIAQADSGRMFLRGLPYAPASRLHAGNLRVRIVTQELSLIPTLTVAENMFMGRMPRRFGLIDYRRMNAEAHRVLASLGLAEIDARRPVAELAIGQQQMVEIASAFSQNCDVLILDEPTAALSCREVDVLFEQIRAKRAAGAAILYISHRMEEIKRIADRITVLRDGRYVATRDADDASMDGLIRLMVGREIGQISKARNCRGVPALRIENLSRGRTVRGVSFTAHRGEILGFAGLMGSGRTETMRLIFGADRPDAGQIFIGEDPSPARIRSPRQAVARGIALLTEDRKQQGILLPMCLRENMTLTRLGEVARAGWIGRRRERHVARGLIDQLSIRCRSAEQPALSLSGGNQQKVVVAKWLFRDCPILICDEPTRGIDIGAKFEIYQLLNSMAAAGKAIIFVSSDLLELMAVCDRIAVMSAGRIVRIFERGQWTQDAIMAAALSGYMSNDTAA